MASGLRKVGTKDFEIYYEKPWGGQASDSNPVDLEPNQLQVQQGVCTVDGALCQFNFPGDPTTFGFEGVPSGGVNAVPILIWARAGQMYAVDQFGQFYVLELVDFKFHAVEHPLGTPIKAPDYPWPSPPAAVRVVNGLAYITNPGTTSIYVVDDAMFTFTLGSAYTGGNYLGVLDDYLLQINTNSAVDGLQPNRVNWSAPGAFTTWDPSLDRSAGFNTLADVDDQLTGFLSFTSVGILISKKSIIEVSPTGVGIQPFNFTTVWTSDLGQGGVFPGSISQWGKRAFLVTDSGCYAISTSEGMVPIDEATRTAIFNSIQNADIQKPTICGIQPLIAGCVMMYAFNSRFPTPYYMFAAVNPNAATSITFWLYDLKRNTWQSQTYTVDSLVNPYNGTELTESTIINIINANSFDVNIVETVPPALGGNGMFANPLTLFWATVRDPNTGNLYPLIITPHIFNKKNIDSSINTPGNLNLVFRAEEIALGHSRKPSIRRAVVKAYGSGDLALSITDVSGMVKSLGTVTLDGTTNANTYYSPSGVATVEAPFLSISSTNFKGVIIKAMLAGTFADGQID